MYHWNHLKYLAVSSAKICKWLNSITNLLCYTVGAIIISSCNGESRFLCLHSVVGSECFTATDIWVPKYGDVGKEPEPEPDTYGCYQIHTENA